MDNHKKKELVKWVSSVNDEKFIDKLFSLKKEYLRFKKREEKHEFYREYEKNRKRESSNRTGYYGVYERKNKNKIVYLVQVMFEGKKIHLGLYNNVKIASAVYKLKLEELLGGIKKIKEVELYKKESKNNASGYRGVAVNHLLGGGKSYEARMYYKGKMLFLGTYKTAKQASDAYLERKKNLSVIK